MRENRLRWQREVGLMSQTRRVWMSARPRCDAAGGGFLSVGLVDVLPALQVAYLVHVSTYTSRHYMGTTTAVPPPVRSQILGVGAALATADLLAELVQFYHFKKVESIQFQYPFCSYS